MEETKQQAERKLISFANPAVKFALDDQKNASALVEALVAKHLNIPFDAANPAHSERVELTSQISNETAPAQDAPATAAALLDNESLPENAPSGIQADEAKAEEDFLNSPLPDVPEKDFLPETPAKPQPMSNDFADLAPNHSPVGVADEVKAELNPTTETAPSDTPAKTVAQETAVADTSVPAEAVPSNPGFVPEAKPEPKILPITNLDEPTPADPAEAPTEDAPTEAVAADEAPTYPAGTKVCPSCGREVLLDTCLNCGYELK